MNIFHQSSLPDEAIAVTAGGRGALATEAEEAPHSAGLELGALNCALKVNVSNVEDASLLLVALHGRGR